MEQAQQLYGFRHLGRRNSEWDLNNWKWDGDLFIASSVDPASVPSNFRGQQFVPVPVSAAAGNSLNSSSSCSDDLRPEPEIGRGPTRDLGQKRRVVVLDEDDDDEAGTLSLKLGGSYPSSVGQTQVGTEGSLEGSIGKKAKVVGGSSNRAVCQVDDCGFDLSNAKDYHRRHKVCQAHSKATQAMVGNVMQRFCQQCSRFHALPEFDEGKRSCRRRLAGHNRRRRKTQPEPVVGVQPINDEQASNVILVSLLKMISDMHNNNRSEPTTDHDMVDHLTRNLASQSGSEGVKDMPGQLREYQKMLNGSLSVGNSAISPLPSSAPRPPRPTDQHRSIPALEMPLERVNADNGGNTNPQAASSQKPAVIFSKDSPPAHAEVRDSAVAQAKLNDFDLNDTYIDPDDGVEDLERSPPNGASGIGPLDCGTWAQQDSQQSSPPQISGNSDSASAHSPSSSSGDEGRTGRIVFKLFGKDPNDFPLMLRAQILDWLAHSPTDLESYIRPGCVILTIYLRLAKPVWEELSSNLGFCLSQLLEITDNSFWQTGWVYTRVQNQASFCYNGQIVVNTSLPAKTSNCIRILSVSPIAVPMSELAHFQIKGSSLSRPTTRLVCALEGKYLAQEDHLDEAIDDNNLMDDDEIECVNLSCDIPSVTGRGFIEVEDGSLSNSFFPFIVAEKDVCSEIRKLEYILDVGDSEEANGRLEARRQAMDFIHEMGWLLHRYQLNSRLGRQNPNAIVFSFKRFKCIMEFSMDRDWCAVVKKLLDIFLEGIVGSGDHPSLEVALSEMDLLHRAVRRNSRSLVELLLHYAPAQSSGESEYGHKPLSNEDGRDFLFRPDKKGPAGLTPLHIAAGTDGSEAVLDALTDDPGKVGVEAWKNARDSTGSTPEDYSRLRGHYAYIRLVQRKVRRTLPTGSVVVDMPEEASTSGSSKRATDGISSFDIASIVSRNTVRSCNLCERKLSYGIAPRARVYRPAMLSIVGIAAVCVCVALLYRGSPDVDCIFRPFRWELLDYGSI